MRRSLLLVLVAIPLVLTACAPGAQPGIAAPTFTVIQNGTGFQTVDPPGVGDGAAVFDVHLRVHNPNPIGLSLATLDGDFYLGDHRAATTSFRHGIDLPASGNGDLTLEVRVPLAQAPALLQTVAGLLTGSATGYRVDATVGVRLFGTVQSFPRATLARGTVRWSPSWVAPELRLAASGPSLHVDAVNSATVLIPATLHNPAPLGYVVRAPSVRLLLGGSEVAAVRLDRIVAPAGATVPVTLRFQFNPLQVGPAVAARVSAAAAGAGSLDFRVTGPLTLEAPGLANHHVDARSLLTGALR